MVPARLTEMSGTESPNRKGPSNSNRSFSSLLLLLPQNICNCCLVLPLVALIVVPLCALLVGLIAARLGRFGSMQSSSVFLAAKPLSSSSFRVKALLTKPTTKTASDSGSMAASAPKWAQKSITLPPHRRGCHLITPKIVKEIGQELSDFKCGLAHLFLHHTSASLTINENYDSDVREDTETFLNKIVPEGRSAPWKHTLEGPDDMPAHIKSSMFGCTLTIPITNGKLNMGTWQGIWLCEHRDVGTPRTVVITMNGI